MTAGPVDLTATFLSPVEVWFLMIILGYFMFSCISMQPSDLVRQSLPLSYLAISAQSNDGQSHRVQVYTDISAEWVTGDNSLVANWTTTTGSIFTHQVSLASQSVYGEVSDHTQCKSVHNHKL